MTRRISCYTRSVAKVEWDTRWRVRRDTTDEDVWLAEIPFPFAAFGVNLLSLHVQLSLTSLSSAATRCMEMEETHNDHVITVFMSRKSKI